MTDPKARPLHAIAGFAAYLREHGFVVGVAEQQSMVHAALMVAPGDGARIAAAWRGVVCHDPDGWRRYPGLFDAYWYPDRLKGTVRVEGAVRPRRDLRAAVAAMHESMDSRSDQRSGVPDARLATDLAGDPETGPEATQGGASRSEALERRDLAQWLPQDLDRLERIVEAIAVRLRRRLLRRRRRAIKGERLDVRGTLRASLRTGGLPFAPVWYRRRRERPRVFVLVDVSRSMETYARLFLRIARAFVGVLDARVFVFHTRLAEVTRLLVRRPHRMAEKVGAVTAGFGGGTRIAESLREFIDVHAGRTLSRASRILILSDGFDSDPDDALRLQLERAKRRGARVYWLHPTVEAPQSGAVRRAGDLVDGFAPVHDLASLARVQALVE